MIATTPTNWNGCALTPVDRNRLLRTAGDPDECVAGKQVLVTDGLRKCVKRLVQLPSMRCTRPGSRSSPESKQHRRPTVSLLRPRGTLAARRRILPDRRATSSPSRWSHLAEAPGAGSSPRQQWMSDQGVPAGSALGRPFDKREGRAVQLEDLLPTGRGSFDSGGEALIQLCATTRLGTVSPGEATAPTRSST